MNLRFLDPSKGRGASIFVMAEIQGGPAAGLRQILNRFGDAEHSRPTKLASQALRAHGIGKGMETDEAFRFRLEVVSARAEPGAQRRRRAPASLEECLAQQAPGAN